jgi:hypothetical protein
MYINFFVSALMAVWLVMWEREYKYMKFHILIIENDKTIKIPLVAFS